jgi:hypothetical protein
LAAGAAVPMPTLLPVTTRSFWLYCPATTVLSANTSNTGSPAALLTLINESLRSSATVKIVPLSP